MNTAVAGIGDADRFIPTNRDYNLTRISKRVLRRMTNKILELEIYFAGSPSAKCGASWATGFDVTGSEAPFIVIASS